MVDEPPIRMPNYEKLDNVHYLVRTQAGYKKALRDFLGPDYTFDSKKQNFANEDGSGCQRDLYIDHRRGYGPYPAVVSFSRYYNGGLDAVSHRWVPLRQFRDHLQALLAKIELHL